MIFFKHIFFFFVDFHLLSSCNRATSSLVFVASVGINFYYIEPSSSGFKVAAVKITDAISWSNKINERKYKRRNVNDKFLISSRQNETSWVNSKWRNGGGKKAKSIDFRFNRKSLKGNRCVFHLLLAAK